MLSSNILGGLVKTTYHRGNCCRVQVLHFFWRIWALITSGRKIRGHSARDASFPTTAERFPTVLYYIFPRTLETDMSSTWRSVSSLAILSYCTASILTTVSNKYVLSRENFNLNFVLLLIQVRNHSSMYNPVGWLIAPGSDLRSHLSRLECFQICLFREAFQKRCRYLWVLVKVKEEIKGTLS